MSAPAWALALIVAARSSWAQVPEPPAPDEHVVRAGETLAKIAATTLGDARLWPALYRANRDQIRDPAVLYPGQRLTIPHASSSLVPDAAEAPANASPRALRP